MKPFRFKEFTVRQHENVFRVGTDGVLLGALANVAEAKNILEVGTGTGLVALMMAQRNPDAEITAIDVNSAAAQLAAANFKTSPFHSRLQAQHSDYRIFCTDAKFDLIISNPPYFQQNSSEKDAVARQQRELTFKSLIEKSVEILADRGKLCVIIPFAAADSFTEICSNYSLNLSRKIRVLGIAKGEPKRTILEFGFNEQNLITEETFVIEKTPRVYSEQYLEATADFHLFS